MKRTRVATSVDYTESNCLGLFVLPAMRRLWLMFVLLTAFGATLAARAGSSSADAPHLHVQLVFPDDNLYRGVSNDAGLYFKLEPGWHVYWKNAGDSGEPPHIRWTLPSGITAGRMQFPAPKRLPLGPLMDFGYEDEVLFPIGVEVAEPVKPGPVLLKAHVDWLVCREVCIPGKADLEKQLRVASAEEPSAESSDHGLWARLGNDLPQPLPAGDAAAFQASATGFRLAVDTGQRETQAEFFPEDEDVLDNPAPQIARPTANGLILDLKKDANLKAAPAQLRGVLELSGGRSYEIAAMPSGVAMPAPSGGAASFGVAGVEKMPATASAFSFAALLSTAFFAFVGGLLLNLMPCVFPVLFLKGLALVNSGSEERHRLRAHGLVYTAGILVSFWSLVALLLGLRAAGARLGWGFQFQSPVFLLLVAGLLFFLGLSLAGQFEIGLTLTSAGGALVTGNGAAKPGYAGSFFTGVLAVVVATPCTAPFMGTAIGYALAQPAAVTFAIFTALALGLAAPYVALTLQPAWTRLLPKPGAWMEILKHAVSVPIFATVICLAWLVAQAYGAALVSALLAIFLLLAVAGWFLGRWPARRWATMVSVLLLLTALAACITAPRELAVAPTTSIPQVEGFAPRGGSGAWQPWSADAVQQALAGGQPVFVDFTAGWCLSCQVNERVALNQPEVMRAFGESNVALFKADWTREDPAITEALAALGRSGVPVYALYVPGEESPRLLPQVLTPGIVLDAIQTLPGAARTLTPAGPSKQP